MATANEIRAARAAARSHLQFEGALVRCQPIIDDEDTEQGYPAPGVNVGRGPHEEIEPTWDGTGDAPPGWTATYAFPEQHPTIPALYAVAVRDEAMRDRLIARGLATAPEIVERDREQWDPPGTP